MENIQNQNSSQTLPCCENQGGVCKCKAPMIIYVFLLSLCMLAFGIYLGKTYFSSPEKNRDVVIVPTPTVVTPTSTSSAIIERDISLLPVATKSAEIVSTEGWKTVSQNGISFKIPSYAKCNNDNACSLVSYEQDYNGSKIPTSISIGVVNSKSESVKEQFLKNNQEVSSCSPKYEDVTFGKIKALQILTDTSVCQGNSGGIALIIGGKFISFGQGGNIDWPIRNTIISTLQ